MEKMASNSTGCKLESSDVLIDVPLVMEPIVWPGCCIYRVPKKLRKVNKEAYTPKLVSIGPFHYRRKELRDMEMHKLKYFKDFLYQTRMRQEDLRKIIEDNELKIRHCYSEDCRLVSTDFVNMILLDAIFIIQLFWMNTYDKEHDYISNKPWLKCGIRHDLILLENQLPFFVLEKLYMFAFNDSSSCNHCEEGMQIEEHKKDLKKQDAPFVKLSRNFFSYYDQHAVSIGEEMTKEPIGEEVKHFTDLLRYLLCSVPDLKPTNYVYNLYCATKLGDAGLKFKPVKRRLLEIKLHQNRCFDCSCLLACLPCLKCFSCLEHMQCILELPPFEIDDDTETVFRNLMALELCHYPSEAYICNYVALLDYLINSEKDVDLLVGKKVIVNNIGSNAAVATLINKLCEQVVQGKSRYHGLAQDLNQHYDFPLNHILATLTSVYFRDFWRGSASVVALIVLIFTFWNFFRPYVKYI